MQVSPRTTIPVNPSPAGTAAPEAAGAAVNAFTVDVEDYFQVAAFSPYIDRRQWDEMPCRVERNMDTVLSLLAHANVKATFFTLGWIAQRYPQLVRNLVAQGHELASHGYGHQRATEMTAAEFRHDVVRARQLLEDIGGEAVIGYRAPSFSIGRDNLWAHDVLAETGHRYSSSIYPIRHDHYGMPEAPRFAHLRRNGLVEIPATSIRVARMNFPASGGGYFRLLPYSISRWSLHHVNRHDGQAVVFYCHPWELDPEQPRVRQASLKARFRHYVNLSRTEDRLQHLLADFRWDRMDKVFASAIRAVGGGMALAATTDS